MASRRKGSSSTTHSSPVSTDLEDKPGAPSPLTVCLVVSILCSLAYTVPYYSQPHHSWEVDILSGVETSSTHNSKSGLNYLEGNNINEINSLSLNSKRKDNYVNDERPAWLLEEIELIYKQSQHKTALTSMQVNDGTRNVWDLFEGAWQCMSKERIGKVGDGGKWICDPHKLKSKSNTLGLINRCLIYSFGSAGESSFEEEAYEKYNCEIHSFDPTLDYETQMKLKSKSPIFYFHPWGIKAHDDKKYDKNYKSLKTIMKELGHDYIDVLKIDIEGSEWDVFNNDILCPQSSPSNNNQLLNKDDIIDDKITDVFDHHLDHQQEYKQFKHSLPFGQLSIELHWSGSSNPDKGEKDLFEFMRGMHEYGYKLFHREANALDIQHCWEYSFVKTNNDKVSSSSLESFIHDCEESFDVRHSKAVNWVHSQ